MAVLTASIDFDPLAGETTRGTKIFLKYVLSKTLAKGCLFEYRSVRGKVLPDELLIPLAD